MQVTLRSLTTEDAPAIAALAESLPQWFNRDVSGLACAEAARCPGVAAVGADGALLGLVIWEHLATDTDIKWIMVAPELHRQGIGRKLMERAIAEAKTAGMIRLIVSTVAPTVDYEPYARSRAFYEALGFMLERVEPGGDGWPDGWDKATYCRELPRE
jgi:GNAT superfamily N-acetyltransferase